MPEIMVTKSIRLPGTVVYTLGQLALEKGTSTGELLRDIIIGYFENEAYETIIEGGSGQWVTSKIDFDISPDDQIYDTSKPVAWAGLFSNPQLVTFERLKDVLVPGGAWSYQDICWIGTWMYFYIYGHKKKPKVEDFLNIWTTSPTIHPAYQFLTLLGEALDPNDRRFLTLLTKIEGWIKGGLL